MTNVAIIGAGAAGLVAAQQMRDHGMSPTIFEQSNRIGGVWLYSDQVESDPLGLSPDERLHYSMYKSLRANLPRDLMAFEDHSFDDVSVGCSHIPRYPSHEHVLRYLQHFARANDLLKYVQFDRGVTKVSCSRSKWRVDGVRFDMVVVCNGHFFAPYVPPFTRLEAFQGLVLHSHNYRYPHEFDGKRVLVLGSSASGVDIAREIASVAETVFFSGRAFDKAPPLSAQFEKIKVCPPIEELGARSASCSRGEVISELDAIIFCTGYRYSFPFLPEELIKVRNNYVHGLHRQIVSIEHPSLAFVGLPFRIVPFPVFQRQARWLARAFSGRFALPPRSTMRDELATSLREKRTQGEAVRHFHRLDDRQIPYMDALASDAGDKPVPDWFKALWQEHRKNVIRYPSDYRDRQLANHGPSMRPRESKLERS